MTIGEVYRKTDEFVKNEKDFTVVSVGGKRRTFRSHDYTYKDGESRRHWLMVLHNQEEIASVQGGAE